MIEYLHFWLVACNKKSNDTPPKEEKPTTKKNTTPENTPAPGPEIVKPKPAPVVQKACKSDKECDAATKEFCFQKMCFTQATAAAYCGKQKECKDTGRCGFFQSACRPTTPAHCLNTDYCKRGGCTYIIKWGVGNCTTSDAACATTEGCIKRGRCKKIGQMCGPKSDDDCKRSEACTKDGRCKRYGYNCAKP